MGTAASNDGWRTRASDHFDPARQRFFNPWKNTDKSFGDLLRWWVTAERRAWPHHVENRRYPPPPASVPHGHAAVTLLGHAGTLIRIGGAVVLTDPHFSPHAGPLGRFGPRRVREPGVGPEALPSADAVFVSHNHYDHLDAASLRWLDRHHHPLFVVPLGLASLLRRLGMQRVVELDWWEGITVGPIEVILTPAQHWSNRAMFDLRRSLWAGCMLRARSGEQVYFAGDSGYAPCFAEIRDRLGPPPVALLPIGAYEPRWFMRDHHMDPEDAVRAHLDLGARTSIAIHHAFFRLTDEGFGDPARELSAALERHGVPPDAFRVLDVGESVTLPAVVD